MRLNPQETANLVTFNEEILNGRLLFLCSAIFAKCSSSAQLSTSDIGHQFKRLQLPTKKDSMFRALLWIFKIFSRKAIYRISGNGCFCTYFVKDVS